MKFEEWSDVKAFSMIVKCLPFSKPFSICKLIDRKVENGRDLCQLPCPDTNSLCPSQLSPMHVFFKSNRVDFMAGPQAMSLVRSPYFSQCKELFANLRTFHSSIRRTVHQIVK